MKRIVTILLVLIFVVLLASCSTTSKVTRNEYVLSTDSKEGSVIDGVMTDIRSDDPVLTKTTCSWADKCVLYEVNIRQYTKEGTFKAFAENLDRLKETGINTLWIMPIHPISEKNRKGKLGSYYAVKDYMDINPEFGTIDDFKDLVNQAHDKGFKVMLDWVANHTGRDNVWISEHKDWYEIDDDGEIAYSFDWDDTAELNYDNYEMRAQMIKCMQYWVEDIGIDGFRCDHAIGVPASFWNAAVYKLKSINSELLFLAENSPAESLTHYAFDSCYNDNLYGQMGMIKGGIAPSTLEQGMVKNTNLVEGSFNMNYLDNHDKNSYNMSVATKYGKSYRSLLAIEYLAPGMPMIYSGNEMISDKELEFFEKDPIEWGECVLQDYLKVLSDMKQNNDSLDSTNQEVEFLKCSNDKMFSFSRSKGDNKIIFVGNMYFEAIKGSKVSFDDDKLIEMMHYNGDKYECTNKEVKASELDYSTLEPYEFYIYKVA